MEEIKVDVTARRLCCVVEKTESTTHEVDEVVSQMERIADCGPILAVKAVVKSGEVDPVLKVAINA